MNANKTSPLICVCVYAGSENNSLYLYYKGLSKTLLTFKFDTVKSVLDKDKKEDDTNEFVSAVCWRALPDGVSSPHYYYTGFDALQNITPLSVKNIFHLGVFVSRGLQYRLKSTSKYFTIQIMIWQ